MSALDSAAAIVGRDSELAVIGRWLANGRPALLEIEGEAGIGKTTLWEEGTRLARDAGALVLQCRPVEIETAVSYGALANLLEPALAGVRQAVPPPRLRALEGALRLRDVMSSSLDETAVALGVLSVVRAAAALQPVVLAVEDVQWLDASSRVALTYALRGVRPGDDVAVLLSRRLDAGAGPLDLRGSTLAATTERLRPGPLSIGAVHRMTHARLGSPLSRPKVVRVHAASRGNPLHALELARVVADLGPHEAELAVPASLADALRARIEALSAPTRAVLLAVAAAGNPRPELLVRVAGPDGGKPALDEAISKGVLVLAEGRVRFSHPLLGSTVYGDAGELERREAHALLAELAETLEERARHLALAGVGPDAALAEALEHAAESDRRRGARGAAAALFEQAASLTPPADERARASRLVAAARAHYESGDPDRARALLEEVAAGDTAVRFDALCRLGMMLEETVGGDASFAPLEAALETDDPTVLAEAHRGLAQARANDGDLERALDHADAAVAAAEPEDRRILAYAFSMQALVRKMAGHPGCYESLERGLAIEAEVELPELEGSPSLHEADMRRLELSFEQARVAYERVLARAAERGDVATECWCRYGLAAIEIAAGRWDRAAEHSEELSELAEQTALFPFPARRTAAHLAVLRGDAERARELIGLVVSDAGSLGELLNVCGGLYLEGLLELSLGDPGAARDPLRRVREIYSEMAIGEPGMLAFLLDEVEALAGVGEAETAAAVLETFEQSGERHPATWVEPIVLRGRGLVAAARADLHAAQTSLEEAVSLEEQVPQPLERARTRLALGRVLRRLQHRSAAQAMLTEALTRFETLGAPLWAERAREELARIGGRAPSRDELTPTERRIAELVAEGLTNREVATTLFVTPHTVESALTRVYRKLGVRSRTELARHLGDAG